jgi:hypothetical protein
MAAVPRGGMHGGRPCPDWAHVGGLDPRVKLRLRAAGKGHIPHISPHWHLLCVPFWMGPGPGRNERADGRHMS